jgi:ubiquitin-activating enzyme E1 C
MLYSRSSFLSPEFEPDDEFFDIIREDANVLVIGAGGLGCELIKDLALSGLKHITIIDMDRIDLTNLNRQFLFRQADVNKYKSQVAAEFVMKRVQGVEIEHYTCLIQEMPLEWFKKF